MARRQPPPPWSRTVLAQSAVATGFGRAARGAATAGAGRRPRRRTTAPSLSCARLNDVRHHAAVGLPDRTRLLDVAAALGASRPVVLHAGVPAIFAQQPWGPHSAAVVLAEEEQGGRAPSMPSYAHLLTVEVAAEVLAVWSTRRAGMVPSPGQAVEALIHYAAHRAHLPVTCEHPGCGRAGARSCSACSSLVCGTHAQGPAGAVTCSSCLPRRGLAPGKSAGPGGAAGRRRVAVWVVPLLGGLIAAGLGSLVGAVPVVVAGACLLVVGACIWLSTVVARMMG